MANPTPVVVTNAQGQALTITGSTSGSQVAAPTPVVLTDINGNALTLSGSGFPTVVASRVVTNSSTVDGNSTQTFYTVPTGGAGVYRLSIGIVARTLQAGAWQVNADATQPSGTHQGAVLGVAVNMVTGSLPSDPAGFNVTQYYHDADVITVGTVTGSGTPGTGAFDVSWVLERLV